MIANRLWGRCFPKRHMLANVGETAYQGAHSLGPRLVLGRPRPRRTNLSDSTCDPWHPHLPCATTCRGEVQLRLIERGELLTEG